MLNEESPAEDYVVLARSVRALAAQAQRVLSRPMTEKEANALLRAIDNLERQLEPGSFQPLSRWVASLRRRVEDHAMTAV